MLRKSLFWGLTLMLVAVLSSLVIRSRREEKKQPATVTEVVRESKPTATRVLSPQDLIIVQSRMELAAKDAGDRKTTVAHH